MSLISLLSSLAPKKQRPRLYIDACHFDPDSARSGDTCILFARNEMDDIYERVTQALSQASAVVVIDQGSTDGTPYFAAEAGAIVIIQPAGQPRELALQEALQVAGQINQNGNVVYA